MVAVITAVYSTEELATAKTEVLAAVDSASSSAEAETVTIASSITFPVAINEIEVGSAARTTFEAGFKAQMAAKLGGGGVFDADEIVIDSVQAGSVEVQFHVEAPAAVQIQAASMLTTLAASGESIAVTVNGAVVSADASAMAAPVVLAAAASVEDTSDSGPSSAPAPPHYAPAKSGCLAASALEALAMVALALGSWSLC